MDNLIPFSSNMDYQCLLQEPFIDPQVDVLKSSPSLLFESEKEYLDLLFDSWDTDPHYLLQPSNEPSLSENNVSICQDPPYVEPPHMYSQLLLEEPVPWIDIVVQTLHMPNHGSNVHAAGSSTMSNVFLANTAERSTMSNAVVENTTGPSIVKNAVIANMTEPSNANGAAVTMDDEVVQNLPPGFRFHPKDDELILHYLMKKISRQAMPSNHIIEIDAYGFSPMDIARILRLEEKTKGYFFTHRKRKYVNGKRPSRTAVDGYWKASGADRKVIYSRRTPYHDNVYGEIVEGDTIGTKRHLAYHSGRAPKGSKTQWMMHEYEASRKPSNGSGTSDSIEFEEYVLCSIYYKSKAQECEKNKITAASSGSSFSAY